jgi:hypothetical protein
LPDKSLLISTGTHEALASALADRLFESLDEEVAERLVLLLGPLTQPFV